MKGIRFVYYLLPALVILIIWEWISRQGPVNQALFPPPSVVALAWGHLLADGILYHDIRDSLWRLMYGLIIGSGSAIFVGLFTGRTRVINQIISPLIQILRPLPAVAIIPLVIVWMGIDDGAKIFTIAYGTFFPVWISTHLGVQQIPNIYLWTARLFNLSRFQLLTKIVLPASLPSIITGIRTGAAIAYAMVFVSELAGASSGIGYRISVAHSIFRIDEMMAALFTLGVMGAITDQLIKLGANRLMPWQKNTTYESNYIK